MRSAKIVESPGGRPVRRPDFPSRWRAELGAVDEDVALIMGSVARLARTIHESYQADLRTIRLTYSEFGALHELRLEGPPYRMSTSRLGELLRLSSGGITKAVDRLEGRGLVRRISDPSDGRGVLVELTARGRKLAAVVFDNGLEKYGEALRHVRRDERDRLVAALQTLLDVFGTSPAFRRAQGRTR